MKDKIVDLIAEKVKGKSEFNSKDDLITMRLNEIFESSLELVEFLIEIETEFNISLDEILLNNSVDITLGKLGDIINGAL